MIFLLVLLLSLTGSLSIAHFYKNKRTNVWVVLILHTIILFFLYQASAEVTKNVERANKLYSEIVLMQPSSIDQILLEKRTAELGKVQYLIDKAVDKYQIQATTYDLRGFKMYMQPFSSGTLANLGDIERGAAEKLKGLNVLIEKQHQLANEIFALQIQVYKPEFYRLNQQLHVLKYSAFDGLIVRMFMSEKVQPVYNSDLYAKNVVIK
jgi:hypothetical protein